MDPVWINPFLDALRRCGVVAQACRQAGVSYGSAYARRKSDGDFAAAWDDALEESYDAMEQEARRRAVEGWDEPIVYQGQLTPVWERDEAGKPVLDANGNPVQAVVDGKPQWLTVRKHSDALLQFLLKGYRRKFGTERQELTGADGSALPPQVVVVTGVPHADINPEDVA